METIILSIANKANRKLLRDWLSTKYNLIDIDKDEKLIDKFDLCIIDGISFSYHEKDIAEIKKKNFPVLVPILFVSRIKDIGYATRNLWKIINELIFTPIQKIELDARVNNLLMNRMLSLKLKEVGEIKLKRSEENYYRLFNLSPDAIFLIDPKGNFVECNNVAINLLGYNKEELLSMKIQQLSSETLAEKVSDDFRKALESKINVDWILRKKDSTELSVNIYAIPIEFEGKKLVLSSMRDITERNKSDEKIQAQLKELQVWQDVTLKREERIIELKKEINELLKQMGKERKYEI